MVPIIDIDGVRFCYFDASVTLADGKVTSVAKTASGVGVRASEQVIDLPRGLENASQSIPVHLERGQLVAGYGDCVEAER